MKRFAIILFLALVSAGVATHAAPLVEVGKTWWYKCIKTDIQQTVLGVRIEGEVELSGTKWHKCQVVLPENRDQVLEPVIAYVRQDGDKVYMLPGDRNDRFADDKLNRIFEDNYWDWVAMSDYELEPSTGYLIYDFSTLAGQKYLNPAVGEITVTDVSTATFGNYTYKKLETKDEKGVEWTQLEGIGVIESTFDGFFFFLVADGLTGGTGRWGMLPNGVTKGDEILWAHTPHTIPWQTPGFELVGFKTWWYKVSKGSMERVIGFHVGDEVELHGMKYYSCRVVDPDNRNAVLDPVVAYLRQDGNRVYMLPGDRNARFADDQINEILNDNYWLFFNTPEGYEPEGTLIYDFWTPVGQTYLNGSIGEIKVTDISEETFRDYTYLKQNIALATDPEINWTTLEGIGVVDSSCSCFFFYPVSESISGLSYWSATPNGVTTGYQVTWAPTEDTIPWELAGIEDARADGCVWSWDGAQISVAADSEITVCDVAGRVVFGPVKVAAGGSLRLPLPSGQYVATVAGSGSLSARKLTVASR